MRILLLSMDFYPRISGGAREDWEFAKTVSASGHQITVVTPLIDGTDRHETVNGVEIVRPFRAWSEDRHPTSVIGMLMGLKFVILVLLYLLREEHLGSIDVIYSTNYMVHPVAKVVGWSFQTPVVNYVAYSPSIDATLGKFSMLRVFEQVIFRLFLGNALICRNPDVRDVVSKVSNTEVHLVHGILNEDTFDQLDASKRGISRHRFVESPDDVLLAYVGRFVEVKHPTGAIEVVNRLPDRFHLVLVGDGEVRGRVEAEINRLDLTDRVTVLGERPHRETLEVIAAADALLLTSKAESYPTVVFEALALKTPVFATPVGILPELDHPRLTVCPDNEISKCLREQNWMNTGTGGVDQDTLREFSVDRFAQETIGVLEGVIDVEKRPRSP